MSSVNDNFLVINEERIRANDVDLNIKEWKMSVDECLSFFRDKTIMPLSDYIEKYDNEIKNKREKENIVIMCTVVNVPYQSRKINDEKFIFWDVSDLKETQSRLYLSGEACEEHEHEKEGVVIALINPFIKDKDPQYYDSRMMEISTKEEIKILGHIDGLDKCKGTTRKGHPCKMVVYIPLQGNYCKYHLKQDRKKNKKKKDVSKESAGETGGTTDATKSGEGTPKEKKEKSHSKKTDAKEKKKKGGEEKEDSDVNKTKESIPEGDEYFDVESIIGKFTAKDVKDKKKKTIMVNERIKELDDYVKLHNTSASIVDSSEVTTTETTKEKEKEKVKGPPLKTEDVIAAQCPELLHLIQKSNLGKEPEEKLKTEEEIKQEKEKEMSVEEKRKLRFEKFVNKLTELYKSKDPESAAKLAKGLIYTTNNFNFHLRHIADSNIFELCYKLMDHRSEEVAIAALKFKRRINKEYIDYLKRKKRMVSNNSTNQSTPPSQTSEDGEVKTKEPVQNE